MVTNMFLYFALIYDLSLHSADCLSGLIKQCLEMEISAKKWSNVTGAANMGSDLKISTFILSLTRPD